MNINQVILVILSIGVGILIGRLSMKGYSNCKSQKKIQALDKTIKNIQDIKKSIRQN
jgi:hypothetical protein